MSGPNTTNPNTRFQPAMRGTASAQQLAAQADDLQRQAQVQAIADAEFARVALLNTYLAAANANQAAARDLAPELKNRVYDFLGRGQSIARAGDMLRAVVPYPLTSAEVTGYTRQRVYNATLIDSAFAAQASLVTQALDGAAAQAEALVNDAWLSVAPSQPDRALAGSVDDALADIRTALSTGRKPADVLAGAMASGDTVLLYALLGEPARRLLSAMGVDRTALVKAWAQTQLAGVAAPDANGVMPLGTGFPGAAFLRLQQDNGGDQALARVPTLARAYYQARLDAAKALLASATVQANLR